MNSVKYTLGELRTTVLKLLGKYSTNGTVYSSGEKADIENRLVTSLNIHLGRIFHEFPGDTKSCRLAFFTPAVEASFGKIDIAPEGTETRSVICRNPGFYMTVGGKGSVTVEAPGYSRTFTVDTLPGERTVIRGAVGSGSECECTFITEAGSSGLYISDFEVYSGVSEEEAGLLFGRNVHAAYLPPDCGEIVGLYGNAGRRIKKFDVTGEENKILLVPKSPDTDCVMEYAPYPPAFADGAGNSEAIYVSPLVRDALVYMCAADLCPISDPELYSRLTYKYREILENMYPRRRICRVVNKFYVLTGKRRIPVSCERGLS